jgi:hypothetical protein
MPATACKPPKTNLRQPTSKPAGEGIVAVAADGDDAVALGLDREAAGGLAERQTR